MKITVDMGEYDETPTVETVVNDLFAWISVDPEGVRAASDVEA